MFPKPPPQLPKLSHQQQSRPVALRQSTPAVDTSSLERLFEAMLSRFEDRFDRLASIMETGLQTLTSTQTRALKKFQKIGNSMDQMVKLMSNQAGANNISPVKEKDSETSELDVERMHQPPNKRREQTSDCTTENPRSVGADNQSKTRQKAQVRGKVTLRRETKPATNETLIAKVQEDGEQSEMLQSPKLVQQLQSSLVLQQHSQPTIRQPKSQGTIEQEAALTYQMPTQLPPQLAHLGEFRDKVLIVQLGKPVEGISINGAEDLEQMREYLSKWVGKVIDHITKEAFHGYFTNKMNELETRVFVCNNIILNFHEMLSYLRSHYHQLWQQYREEIIHHFQDSVIQALTYYLIKYPQKNKIFLSEELKAIVTEVNDSNLPEYNMLKKFGVPFNPIQITKKENKVKEVKEGNNDVPAPPEILLKETDYDYGKKIKKLLNVVIQESNSFYYEFKELMTDVLSITVENSTTKQPLPDQKICMKFKEDMSLYSEEQINHPGVPIKSPEVLRVLIKWIEELDAVVANPKQNLLEKEQKRLFNMNLLEAHMRTQYYKELVAVINGNRDKHFNNNSSDKSILDSAYKGLSDYIRERKKQFGYLPDSIVKSGMTVNLLSTLTYDIAVLYLKRQISFLYQMHHLVYDKLVQGGVNRFIKPDDELITFSVSDLLRAKCSGTIEQIRQVINNIQQKEGVKIVKIRNRLATGNRDFLINFMFGECKLVCEVQVGLKDNSDNKGSYLDHFNHFLYELRRSKFGPLCESALIIANQVDIGAYFKQQTQPLRRTTKRVEFNPVLTKDLEFKIEGFEPQEPQFTFLCNNCLEITNSRLLSPWKRLQEDEFVCGMCIYQSLDRQKRAIYTLGAEIGPFFEEVEWEQEKEHRSEYIIVVTNEELRSLNVYSSYRPSDHSLQAIRNADPATKKALQNTEFNEYYYMCFGKLSDFYGEDLIKHRLVFRLKPQLLTLVLKFSMNVPRAMINDPAFNRTLTECLVDCPENKQKLPYPNDQLYAVGWTLSDDLSEPPERFETVRCAVDLQQKSILILDNDRETSDIGAAQVEFLNKKVDSTIDRKWLLQWDYSKRQFDDETFNGLPDDNSVQTICVDQNNFTRIDFLRSKSLQKLSMNLNKIKELKVKDNYPNLMELNLIKNSIEVLDLTGIDLPHLWSLEVSNNRIRKIVTRREKYGSTEAILNSLTHLVMRFNNLEKWDIIPTDFPKLVSLALSTYVHYVGWNKPLTELDMTGFDQLSYTSITKLTLQGLYNDLEEILAAFTPMEHVDLSNAETPNLREINMSYSKLRSFKLPMVTTNLVELRLSCNFLEEFKLTKTEPGNPRIDWNKLKKIDISRLPTSHSLYSLNISRNGKPAIIFPAEPFTLSGVPIKRDEDFSKDDDFRMWRMFTARPEFMVRFRQWVRDNSYEEPEYAVSLIDSIYYMVDDTYKSNCQLSEQEIAKNREMADFILNYFEMTINNDGIIERQDRIEEWEELFTRQQQQILIYRKKAKKQKEEQPEQLYDYDEMAIARDYVPNQTHAEMFDDVGGAVAAGPLGPPAFDTSAFEGAQPDFEVEQPANKLQIQQVQQEVSDDDELELAVETMEVPTGTECATCHSQLILPYYYYIVTKVHRCCKCAEQQNPESQQKLKRYAVNENAILLFQSGKAVDVKRCGTNIQPKDEQECKSANFICNGCGGYPNNQARYICMGCRREPNNGDLVDFCYECAKKLRTESIETADIMDRCERDGHQLQHCLLRVLWGPRGYYTF